MNLARCTLVSFKNKINETLSTGASEDGVSSSYNVSLFHFGVIKSLVLGTCASLRQY